MIELGKYNTLSIKRKTSVGLYLSDEEGNDILLPNKYVPPSYDTGEELEVFCYLDNEQRPVATTIRPFVQRDEFAFLRVAEVNPVGAFLDWGLEKHLLVPYREQSTPMIEGKWYVIHCFLDPKSSRLVASSRLERFLDNSDMELVRGQQVELLISRQTELGWEVIVNGAHKGLVYTDDIYEEVTVGDRMTGYIKKIRDDNKLDVTFQPLGQHKLEPSALKIYQKLQSGSGVLKLHDRSDPEEIKRALQMSKKTFKKAIGVLYKQRKIVIKEDGIYKV